MPTPETPGPEPELDPEAARIKLEIKKQIRDTMAESPMWKNMNNEEQEKLAEDLFNNTWAVFLGQYDREHKAKEQPAETPA